MPASTSTPTPDLLTLYRSYLTLLNTHSFTTTSLSTFVSPTVRHNNRPLGISGYVALIEKDISDIPDLHFDIQLLIVQGDMISARLEFNVTPKGEFMGVGVNGKKVKFCENVFYRWKEQEDGGWRIEDVWSVVDKSEIERQVEGVAGEMEN